MNNSPYKLEFKIDLNDQSVAKWIRQMNSVCNQAVNIGYNKETSGEYNNGMNVAEVALINEYGFGHNPPRPFMRKTLEDHKMEYEDYLKDNFEKITWQNPEKEIGEFLMTAGKKIQVDLQETISTWDINDPRPNKDGSQPLVGTGKMRDSVEVWMDKIK